MLARQVAEYLLERGWITAAQLEEAQRTQGFFGGRLETHLLKLGYVTEQALGEALTEVSGVPYASWEHLRSAPQNALDAIPVSLIERHRVCPFRIENGRLRVATLTPRDAVALRELQAATAHVLEPWIASEPKLNQALERHFKLRVEAPKGINVHRETSPRPRGGAAPPPEPAAGPRSAEPEVGLDGRPLDAEVSFEEFATDREAIPPSGVSATATAEGGLDALDEAFATARDRDEIAEALFAFCASRAGRCGLFAVGREAIRGIAGRGRAFDTDVLRKFNVPVGLGTLFDTALRSRDFYFGVVPGLPANRDLYTALGGRLPANVMLLPVLVKERIVALLYLDNETEPLSRPDIPLMRRVAAKASLAFELVLLRNKLREI